jgi:hypothetical protein
MKLLIGVASCQRDRAMHDPKRALDDEDLKVNVRFFLGGPKPDDLASDEIWLDVNDDYQHLPQKVAAMAKWMVDQQTYTHLMKVDNDTKVILPELLNSGFESYDWSGDFNFGRFDFCPGGGYVLSRRAAEKVAEKNWTTGAEDRLVASVMDPLIRTGEFNALNLLCRSAKYIPERRLEQGAMCVTPQGKRVEIIAVFDLATDTYCHLSDGTRYKASQIRLV